MPSYLRRRRRYARGRPSSLAQAPVKCERVLPDNDGQLLAARAAEAERQRLLLQKGAVTLFKAAFVSLDNAKGDARALSVARRVHDGAYTRLAGSPDSATPYTHDRTEAPPFMPDASLHPDLELNR